jgi:hypothetical protein
VVFKEMSDVEQYRRMAEDCLHFANQATDEEEKATLLQMAQTLHKLIEKAARLKSPH